MAATTTAHCLHCYQNNSHRYNHFLENKYNNDYNNNNNDRLTAFDPGQPG